MNRHTRRARGARARPVSFEEMHGGWLRMTAPPDAVKCAICQKPCTGRLGDHGFFQLPIGWLFCTLGRVAPAGGIESVAMITVCSDACAVLWNTEHVEVAPAERRRSS
jgi:hypothetical protein